MNDQLQRITTITQLLKHTYPHAHIMLNYKTPWELLVAVMLSAQCTDIMVNKVTATLFIKYPTITDVVHANQEEFEQDIRSTGFYRNKAKHAIAAANLILQKFNGRVPNKMEELLTIPGVARKTANVVLANAYNITPGIAVDTHVIRLSQRLRLVPINEIGGKQKAYFKKNNTNHLDFIKDADPVKIEKKLMELLPKAAWKTITYQIIDHGRAVCTAQKPHCQTCVLSNHCPASRV